MHVFLRNRVGEAKLKCVHQNNRKECLIRISANDLLIPVEDLKTTEILIEQIRGKYDAEDLGQASIFCGMLIERNGENTLLYLFEQDKVKGMINQFNVHNSRTRKTPLGFTWTKEGAKESC